MLLKFFTNIPISMPKQVARVLFYTET